MEECQWEALIALVDGRPQEGMALVKHPHPERDVRAGTGK
jgi:hypothetical protein